MRRRQGFKIVWVIWIIAIFLSGCGKRQAEDKDFFWISDSIRRICGEQGMFHFESGYLYFKDVQYGTDSLICGDSTCSHNRETCPAYFGALHVYAALENDHLLVVTDYKADKAHDLYLYETAVDGSNRKQLAYFGNMQGVDIVQFTKDVILVSYYNSYDEDLKPLDVDMAGVYAYDRRTGEGEFIWTLQALNSRLIKAFYQDDAVYFSNMYYTADGEKKVELQKYNLKTKELTMLEAGTVNEISGEWSLFGNKLLYHYMGGTWQYDIVTEEKKQVMDQCYRLLGSYGTEWQLLRDADNFYTYTEEEGVVKLEESGETMIEIAFPKVMYADCWNEETESYETVILSTAEVLNGKQESPVQNTQKPEENIGDEADDLPENTNVITWAVPEYSKYVTKESMEAKVKSLNQRLYEDGYNFALEIIILPKGQYRQQVVPMLEDGSVDIAFAGQSMVGAGGSYAQDFIREGYFEDLSGYLASEQGQTLWNWYSELEWKRSETDGKYYVIPNQYGMAGSGYLAFSKKYVTEEMLEGFEGTPAELGELLSLVEIEEGDYGVLGSYSLESLLAMDGATTESGVAYDLQTGVAENPFEREELFDRLLEVRSLYQKGYIKVFDVMSRERLQTEAVKNGNFVVWIDYGRDSLYEEVKDTVHVLPLRFAMANTVSCTNGVNKNSFKKEEALQLLTLIYTNETYANLLLYGVENKDYQLINGYVCDINGMEIRNNGRYTTFGIYDAAHPCHMDYVISNRREVKNKHYTSEYCLDSAILGFQQNSTGFSAGMKNAMALLQSYSEIWQEKDLEAAWAKANEEFKASGGDELVAELNRQVEEWKQNTGN